MVEGIGVVIAKLSRRAVSPMQQKPTLATEASRQRTSGRVNALYCYKKKEVHSPIITIKLVVLPNAHATSHKTSLYNNRLKYKIETQGSVMMMVHSSMFNK